MNIKIPVDSRIMKIWEKFDIEGKDIQDYLQKISEKYSIPPLHLDSLLWIKLWQEI
jgi:N-glycosylase/DNA lyase